MMAYNATQPAYFMIMLVVVLKIYRYTFFICLIYRISLKGGEFFMAYSFACYLLLTITNSLRRTFSRERTLPRRQMLLCFTDHPSSSFFSLSLPCSLFPWDEIRRILTREKKMCSPEAFSNIITSRSFSLVVLCSERKFQELKHRFSIKYTCAFRGIY